MSGTASLTGCDLKPPGCSTAGRTYSGPTMQPPAITLRVASAPRTRSRPRHCRNRIRTLAPRWVLRGDRRDKLALLEGHRGLLHDRFVALQSGLDVDRGPEVPAELHRLKVRFVSRPHDRHPGAVRVEDDRGGR